MKIPTYYAPTVTDSDGEPQALIISCGENGMLEGGVDDLIFYYRRNLQGDITGLLDTSGELMCELLYDAYGNFSFEPAKESIGGVFESIIAIAVTPISYRGYVYTSLDSKHCYYYLGSRFYSPLLSRFMNADSITDTGTGVVGTNMFAYCNNSPVVCVDPEGTVELATIAGVLGISVAELISGAFMLIFAVAIISNGDVIISFSEAIICIAEDKLNAVKNKLATLAYSEVVALSVSISSIKTKTKIKNEKKRYDYWIAEYKDYGDEMGVFYATYGISFDTAKSVVKSGKSVFASSRDKAKKLARAIGKYKPRHDSPHSHVDYGSLGYWPHYHAMANKNTSIGGHIFYV